MVQVMDNYYKVNYDIEYTPTPEEYKLLVRQAKEGSEEALNEIIKGSMRLLYNKIYSLKDFYDYSYDVEDLLQIGLTKIVEAIPRYDESKGYGVLTYLGNTAYFGMKHHIINYPSVHGLKREFKNTISKIRQNNLENRTPQEVAEYFKENDCGIREAYRSVKFIEDCLECIHSGNYHRSKYFGEVIIKNNNENDNVTVLDVIKNKKISIFSEDTFDLYSAMNQLTAEEQFIVTEYYINDKTQSEIAQELGVEQASVSRRIKRALRKLKNIMQGEVNVDTE